MVLKQNQMEMTPWTGEKFCLFVLHVKIEASDFLFFKEIVAHTNYSLAYFGSSSFQLSQ